MLRCSTDCRGNCEVFKSSFRGREVIYPGPFGEITAGGDKDYPIDYSHLNIMGYALGAEGLPEGVEGNPDNTLFPLVDTETEFGYDEQGEDEGADLHRRARLDRDRAQELGALRGGRRDLAASARVRRERVRHRSRRSSCDAQRQGHDARPTWSGASRRTAATTSGYGDILVQINVEDTRLGVAEYVVEKLGVETIELKWGQGAKCIGGEIKVDTLERALELQKRGYLVTPDPSDPAIQKAFQDSAIQQFERHSRLGFVDEEEFYAEVEHLRGLGAKRVTLKTGAYPMRELAMAIKWASNAKIDLLTIDGAPGGTGMSPWRMMEEWGVPTFYLQCMTNELARAPARARAPTSPTSRSPAASPPRTTSSRCSPWARRTPRPSAWAARS